MTENKLQLDEKAKYQYKINKLLKKNEELKYALEREYMARSFSEVNIDEPYTTEDDYTLNTVSEEVKP